MDRGTAPERAAALSKAGRCSCNGASVVGAAEYFGKTCRERGSGDNYQNTCNKGNSHEIGIFQTLETTKRKLSLYEISQLYNETFILKSCGNIAHATIRHLECTPCRQSTVFFFVAVACSCDFLQIFKVNYIDCVRCEK